MVKPTKLTAKEADLSKEAKVLHKPGGKKTPAFRQNPDNSALERKIGWNFARMDSGGDWACTISCLEDFKNKLLEYEGKTINEIFTKGQGNNHSHHMPVEKIEGKAKQRLDNQNIDNSSLSQLKLGQVERLWGILEHNIFHILWLDRKHTVCKTKR